MSVKYCSVFVSCHERNIRFLCFGWLFHFLSDFPFLLWTCLKCVLWRFNYFVTSTINFCLLIYRKLNKCLLEVWEIKTFRSSNFDEHYYFKVSTKPLFKTFIEFSILRFNHFNLYWRNVINLSGVWLLFKNRDEFFVHWANKSDLIVISKRKSSNGIWFRRYYKWIIKDNGNAIGIGIGIVKAHPSQEKYIFW